jgi:hypothetical protein
MTVYCEGFPVKIVRWKAADIVMVEQAPAGHPMIVKLNELYDESDREEIKNECCKHFVKHTGGTL